MSNVFEFRPKPLARQAKPPSPTIAEAKHRDEWVEAVKAVWADPARWRTTKKGNRYIVIEECDISVTVYRNDNGWSWSISWREESRPKAWSNWTYVGEKSALDAALDAVLVLA